MTRIPFLLLFCLALSCMFAQTVPAPYGPVPMPAQIQWQRMEMNMFVHFGPNTFTGKEWGEGTETEDIFQPTRLDCEQWVRVAKEAGFQGIIVTAKHHDGFCLWPNPASTHTVRQSAWRNGQGDVLRELSEACSRAGLKFGIYVSPWDRNAPTYGTRAYNRTYCRTLRSALSKYGPVFELWFDGACGEGPNGKRQVYDWERFRSTVRRLQPQAVMFSDVGPGCRWVGNEEGRAGHTNWSRLDVEGFAPGAQAPPQDTLTHGNRDGACWVPAETDVSIRPGWFYRDSEHPRSLQELLRIFYTSVGRNSLLLLNVPPDSRGLIAEEDAARLRGFRTALDSIFARDLAHHAVCVNASNIRGAKEDDHGTKTVPFGPLNLIDDDYDTFWATEDSVTAAEVLFEFEKPQTFNRVALQEYIPLGQRVERFHVEVLEPDGIWRTVAEGTTVGYKRIVLFDKVTAQSVRIVVDKSRANPLLNKVGFYLDEIYQSDCQIDVK